METYYSQEELKSLGLKKYGDDVKISRHAILYKPEELELGSHVRIDDFTTISGRVVLGNYIHIAQMCGLYGASAGITMDDFSTLSSHTMLYATSNDYSGHSLACPMVPEEYRRTDINAPVYLEEHVLIGCMSVVLPGVTIGEGCSIGAMSLVRRSLEPWGMYAGIPVRRLRNRSKQLLELKSAFQKSSRADGPPRRSTQQGG